MRGLLASKQAVVGLSLLLLFALIAIVGPYLVQDPTAFAGVPLEPGRPMPVEMAQSAGIRLSAPSLPPLTE